MNVWEIEFIAKTQYAELSSAYRNNGNTPSCNIVAPRVGIEPTTKGLTVPCSTAELPRNIYRIVSEYFKKNV